MRNIQAVIFDMDGTLLDTEKVYRRAWLRVGEEMHFASMEKALCEITGRNFADTRILFAQKYPEVDFDALHQRREVIYEEIIRNEGVPVKPGAVELIRWLAAKGIKLGIGTSTQPERTRSNLREIGVLSYFEALVTGNMVEHGKPHPETFLKAAELLKIDPANCMGVEDSFNGVRAIHDAGMLTVMVPDTLQPTPEVEAMLDLKAETLWDIIPFIEQNQ